ncbi:MAG: hypothetical protein P1U37_01450 [Minwuia sp.]|nr:hypothetical protein [Minwuia sp.]
MTAQLFAIIAPVFIIAGFGFGWRRLRLPFDTATVTAIATNLGTPALILATLAKLEVSAEAFAEMLFATALTLVGFAVLGGLALKLARLPLRAWGCHSACLRSGRKVSRSPLPFSQSSPDTISVSALQWFPASSACASLPGHRSSTRPSWG